MKKYLLYICCFIISFGLGWISFVALVKGTSWEGKIRKLASRAEKTRVESREASQPPKVSQTRDKETSGQKESVQVVPQEKKVEKKAFLELESEKKEYQQGDTFIVSVYGFGMNEVVDGVEFTIDYNPEFLEVTNLQKGSFFQTYLKNKIDQQDDQIKVIAVQDSEEKMAKELIAQFSVKTLEQGTTDLSFLESESQMAALGGQDILGQLKDLSLEIK